MFHLLCRGRQGHAIGAPLDRFVVCTQNLVVTGAALGLFSRVFKLTVTEREFGFA